jgi:hypothetical protein
MGVIVARLAADLIAHVHLSVTFSVVPPSHQRQPPAYVYGTW